MVIGFLKRASPIGLGAIPLLLFLGGCATVPGKTKTDQIQTVDQLIETTLADLVSQNPAVKKELERSVGYVIMNNKITKIPVFGAGAGYGAAVARASGEKTYLRMARFDFGAGWGARSVRPVLIFFDEPLFQKFIRGTFKIKMSAEASAKVGETGAAGGTGGHPSKSESSPYSSYLITDAGVSATWAVGFIRVKPIQLRGTE